MTNDEDEDNKITSVSLSESLEGDIEIPPDGAAADVARLQKLGERTLINRTKLLDRFNHLPLYGKSREKASEKKSRWRIDGVASDHPLVQMILSLRLDEDELATLELEPRDMITHKLKIKTKIADLLISLQKENDQVFKELQTYIEHETHKNEHKDKMNEKEKKGLADLSDAELIRIATSKDSNA